jgi:integrase
MEKPLYIPPAKRLKGLGLTVYCYKCLTNVSDVCKETGDVLLKCPFGNKHTFKVYVHVPGSDNKRKTKKLKTGDVNEAIKQAIEFQQKVKENISSELFRNDNKKESVIENENTPVLLIHCIARYIGWLQNENVPFQFQRERSSDYLSEFKRSFKTLVTCIRENRFDLNKFRLDQIDDRVVGTICEYLTEEKKFSNRTFNKYIKHFRSLVSWYSREYNTPIKNCFIGVFKQNEALNPESISKEEYDALLKIIKPETGIKNYKQGKKRKRNMYQPWLIEGIRLGLETGRRREEIITLKYSDIKDDGEGNLVIKVEDYKVNRIKNRLTEKVKNYIYIPVTESLRSLLDELGYEKYKGTENFILAPEIKSSRTRFMSDALSRGFSHYYDQLDTGKELTFRCLRKTYITNLSLFMGGNARAITKHSDETVIEKYYLDKQVLAKAAKDFSVFSKEAERKNELEQLRDGSKFKQKEMEVEK